MLSDAFLSTCPSPSLTSPLISSSWAESYTGATFFVFCLFARENLSAVVLFTQKFTNYLKNIYPAKRMKIPVDIVNKTDADIKTVLFV
jgi:hypothetical protein